MACNDDTITTNFNSKTTPFEMVIVSMSLEGNALRNRSSVTAHTNLTTRSGRILGMPTWKVSTPKFTNNSVPA